MIQPPQVEVNHQLEELRRRRSRPSVWMRHSSGVEVACWIATVGFTCPDCGVAGFASRVHRDRGAMAAGCTSCGARFELRFP